METITKTQIENIAEATFNQLIKQNPMTLVNRIKTIKSITPNDMMYGVNEYPSLMFQELKNLGEANFKMNVVYINSDLLFDYLNNYSIFISPYKKEIKYIHRNVVTKEDAVKWIVAHEVAHTIRLDKVNHTLSFFQTVEELFKSLK